jgi:tRNA (guanine9-N1)-methyltransferase
MEEKSPSPTKKLKTEDCPFQAVEAQAQAPTDDSGLSKNQQKKLIREKKWLETKDLRPELRQKKRAARKVRRDDLKALIATKEEQGEDVSDLLPQLQVGKPPRLSKEEKITLLEKLESAPKVIIDCDFELHMKDGELNSLVTQFSHFLAQNKKSEHPINIVLSGVGPRMDAMLTKRMAYKWNAWLGLIYKETYLEKFPLENLVYLTGDSETNMSEFDSTKNYIIGGLIDHNKLKNITLDKAKKEGVMHQRFPMADHVKLKMCPILAVNHVASILLRLNEGCSWAESFKQAIPDRKIDDGESPDQKDVGQSELEGQEAQI